VSLGRLDRAVAAPVGPQARAEESGAADDDGLAVEDVNVAADRGLFELLREAGNRAAVVLMVARQVDDGAGEALRKGDAAALHVDIPGEDDHVHVVARGRVEWTELEVQV
jgi:hypothetical protein